jgi:hypothetical protein
MLTRLLADTQKALLGDGRRLLVDGWSRVSTNGSVMDHMVRLMVSALTSRG